MKKLTIILMSLLFMGAACPIGDFGVETEEGEAVNCVTNQETCVQRCEVKDSRGLKVFKNNQLTAEQCTPQPPAPPAE